MHDTHFFRSSRDSHIRVTFAFLAHTAPLSWSSQPSMFMLEYMQKKFGIAADEICMVGDRLDTDIEFGNNGGARTMLVLSGVTTEETLLSPENAIKPDFYAPNLPELAKSTSVTA